MMEEYDLTISYGFTDVRVRIETSHRDLLDMMRTSLQDAYDRWQRGERATV